MTTTRFQEVAVPAKRRGKCPTCDKAVTRSRTFTMTISPFNRNPDGTIRTAAEVWAACEAKAEAWQPEPSVFEHGKCVDAREAAIAGRW